MPKLFDRMYLLLVSSMVFISGQATQVPLIPRAVLFGDPDKTNVRISPDGTKLAYLAPVDGVLNIWVKTIGKEDDPYE
jgi:hypothetical protein